MKDRSAWEIAHVPMEMPPSAEAAEKFTANAPLRTPALLGI
jgi:hypothetical protein